MSDRPVDELDLKPETKALLKESLFVHPLPFVETVIFIATPHGGSYQAGLTAVGLFEKLVTLPITVATAAADILTNAGAGLKLDKERRYFSSVAGMSPGNPVIGALRTIPMAPGIHGHSIIPTLQDGPLDARNDGVVEYKGAHIDVVESEVVIEHSRHSTQSNPLTVREVRRILMEQLGLPGCASPPFSAKLTERGARTGTVNGIDLDQCDADRLVVCSAIFREWLIRSRCPGLPARVTIACVLRSVGVQE